MKNFPHATANSPSLLRRVARLVVAIALIGLVLMFSALLFIVVLTAGTMVLGYLWWKTRDLRKQMRNHPLGDEVIRGEVIEGEIIEGEVIRVIDSRAGERQRKTENLRT
jgi:hypothetical protein